MKQSDIDFVVLWVDGNDPEWQRKKACYQPAQNTDTSKARYRDWENLRYWFRSVEAYAPWVRKVHFVSDSQVPEWLNVGYEKLNIVKHEDYMPHEVLPVFNSSAIEVGIYRIEGLSNKFVFFNDDVFLAAPIKEENYFVNQMPVDMAGITRACKRTPENVFANHLMNDYEIINKYFEFKNAIKTNFCKWYNPLYGKTFLRTLLNYGRDRFDGIVIPHLSAPYLKTDFEKVWAVQRDALEATQGHRFRSNEDVNQYLFRFWRLCSGEFVPKRSRGKYFSLSNMEAVEEACCAIKKRRYPEICLNDNCSEEDFVRAKDKINEAFQSVLMNKSRFEK